MAAHGVQYGLKEMLNPTALYSLALLLLLTGCQTGKPRTPQETGEFHYGKW
ncbi:hypothetical protein LXA45_17770 [Erwinia amylovora]|nr:hypothetical protein [Erwinia amylovora]MCK8407552.1 hypothetical protein [Erwinia amylovora]